MKIHSLDPGVEIQDPLSTVGNNIKLLIISGDVIDKIL